MSLRMYCTILVTVVNGNLGLPTRSQSMVSNIDISGTYEAQSSNSSQGCPAPLALYVCLDLCKDLILANEHEILWERCQES